MLDEHGRIRRPGALTTPLYLESSFDIVIVGAGLVGASLACALSKQHYKICLLDAAPLALPGFPNEDDRGLSLAPASKHILQAMGIWDQISSEIYPLQQIHVSCQGHFGCVRMSAREIGMPALGYVVVAKTLAQILLQNITAQRQIKLRCPETVTDISLQEDHVILSLASGEQIQTRLLVAADGSDSPCRDLLGIHATEKHYAQTAIVANVTNELAHQYTAFERFTPSGPLALLPLQKHRAVMVQTLPSEQAEAAIASDEQDFLSALEQGFGRRLGRIEALGKRRAYPLRSIHVKQQVGPRYVLLGNAAHSVHPNAAQGFNLALRDVAGLADLLLDADAATDPGLLSRLQSYQTSRAADQARTLRFCDGLTRIFYNNYPLLGTARGLGLTLLNNMPPLKQGLMQRLMGLWGEQPAWVCERGGMP